MSIHIDGDGAVFVNEARVINTDVLIAGGVLHVLEDVLNPSGRNVPYPGASGVDVPFTSGIAPETSIYDELSGTTSFVAAGPAATPASVSGSPGMSGNATMATQGSASPTSSGPIQQTANAAATDGARVVMAGLLGAAAAVVAL